MTISSLPKKENAQEKCSYILEKIASLLKSNESFFPESNTKLERIQ